MLALFSSELELLELEAEIVVREGELLAELIAKENPLTCLG